MTGLFKLSPEVAGQLGERTVLGPREAGEGRTDSFPEITHVEYIFDGWLGDDLLESFPVFITTEPLANALIESCLSGVKLEQARTTTSDQFRELYPQRKLPSFRRLAPEGRVQLRDKTEVLEWTGHDLCLSQNAELVVTRKALTILQKFKLDNCDVEELTGNRRG